MNFTDFYYSNGMAKRCCKCFSKDAISTRNQVQISGVVVEYEEYCPDCNSSLAHWAEGQYNLGYSKAVWGAAMLHSDPPNLL